MGADQSYLVGEDVKQNHVNFFLNGKECMVNPDHDNMGTESRLVDYIRDCAGLKGTKYVCREGGCGACVVSVKMKDPVTGDTMVQSVNSCLVPVFSADGWDITTVEGLGSKAMGYHKIQDQIVNFSGTQCGFCTPGMVMNMFSLTQSKPGFKAHEVEDAFDGNMCRCTGYRPILDAFKSMAVDASEELKRKCSDMPKVQDSCCKKNVCCKKPQPDDATSGEFEKCSSNSKIYLKLKSGEEWVRATTMAILFEAIQKYTSAGMKYRVVAGNTGTGVYKYDGPYQAYVDINGIPDLKMTKMNPSIVELGGGVTLSNAIDLLQKASEMDGYFYTAQISKHLKRVANTPIRNVATLAGNLMIKHFHKEFPSDVFLLLETVGAKLTIGTSATVSREYSLMEFRSTDMNGKIIISIRFPAYKGGQWYMNSFKVARRYQNSHAYVNAGFMMKVDPRRNFSVRDKPTIVFGGINPDFVHAIGTEISFVGKFLDPKTIRNAMDYLEKEIQPSMKLPDASPEYRRGLAQSLLYKFILGIMGDSISPMHKSGSHEIERNLMYAKQDYGTDKSEWPLGQPMPKLEARVQASGEAQYVNDINPEFGELHGAFFVSTVGNAVLKGIDPSEAMMMPGVITVLSAKDIPGLNNYAIFSPTPETVFVKDKIGHAGQALGLVVAETREIALAAAKKVSVMYDDIKQPILDIKGSLNAARKEGRYEECLLQIRKSVVEPVTAAHTIKGEFEIGSQFHFHMETQTCICIPREDGMDVFSSTQFPNHVQMIITANTGIPSHSINVSVKRLGGGYGAKLTRSSQVAAACAVAAQATGKPVRLVMDVETNMKTIGKRLPYLAKYEVGVDDSGAIMNMKCEIFCDSGHNTNEETTLFAMVCIQNCYRASGWEVIPGKAMTNTASNTYCRAPGSTQAIAVIENIMEHIAHTLKKDPLDVRMANFLKEGDPIFGIPGLMFRGENPLPKLIEELKMSTDHSDRVKFINNFNMTNRWKKRGMSLVPLRFPIYYVDFICRFPVYIAVYVLDGTVSVSHGGIEMGQGINTKCAQVVAHTLKIPIEKIQIKPTNNLISPNADLSGNAVTSELVCNAAMEACKILMEKMEPVRKEMKDAPWEQLVGACYAKQILLNAHYQGKHNDVMPYEVWGLALTEVEIDILTGENKIVRVDLVEDAGISLSPDVDIGQIEGAYIMGLGMWLTEKLVYDKNTGELLTHNTWEYKPPFAKDIPEDFRVSMIRNRPNATGVLRSKATGEIAITMSAGVVFAIRNALDSARADAGNTDWYQMDGPVTPEDIHRLALTSMTQFDV